MKLMRGKCGSTRNLHCLNIGDLKGFAMSEIAERIAACETFPEKGDLWRLHFARFKARLRQMGITGQHQNDLAEAYFNECRPIIQKAIDARTRIKRG